MPIDGATRADHVATLTARIHRYCELFDSGRMDEFAAQFEHGRWHRAEPGAAATRQWIADHVILHDGVPATQHCTSNLVVDVADDGQTATASAYVTVFQRVSGVLPLQPIFGGLYRDRFQQVDGDWQWLERSVHQLVRGDTSQHVR